MNEQQPRDLTPEEQEAVIAATSRDNAVRTAKERSEVGKDDDNIVSDPFDPNVIFVEPSALAPNQSQTLPKEATGNES